MNNEKVFDQLAESYDTTENRLLSKVTANAIRKILGESGDKKAIDFGCGTGLVGLELIDSFQSIHFIDASRMMIEQVKRKIKLKNITNATTDCIDLESDDQLSFQTDVIFMSLVLHHITDRRKVMAKLFKILNKGGELIIIDINKEESDKANLKHRHHNTIDKTELIDLLTDTGFTVSETSEIVIKKESGVASLKSLFILKGTKEH